MSQVVFITGASSGLGLALGQYLQQRGYRVYGTSRKGNSNAVGFPLLRLDVGDPESIQKAVAEVLDREGRIDVLINNAGVGMGAPVERSLPEDIQALFDVNVFGLIRVCQAVLPAMRAAGRGRIFNISSIAGSFALPFRGVYAASKAAVDRLSEALRMELGSLGVEVCAIRAGDIRTSIKEHWVGHYREEGDAAYGAAFQRVVKSAHQGLDKGTPPEEVARQLEQLIQAPRLKKSYVIGKLPERLSLLIWRALPSDWFEGIIRKYSKL